MTDKAFEKMMEQKRIEAATPGHGARCATKAREAKTRTSGDKNIQELTLS